GRPIRAAVIEGTNQVMLPVVSSALTTVAAFLPLLLMTGMIGRFFSIIPKTVTVTLLASLFECLVILPNHYLHWGPRRGKSDRDVPKNNHTAEGRSWSARALQFYLQVVEQAMTRRYLCLAVLAALALCAYQGQRTLAVELFPSDFPTLVTTYSAAPGSSLEQTDDVSQKMMHVFEDLAEKGYAKAYSSTVGFQVTEDSELHFRPNLVQIVTELRQRGKQDYDPERVMDETRRRLSDFVRDNPQLSIENLTVWAIQDGPPIGKPVAIRIEHPDYEVAKQIAAGIEDRLRRMVGVFDISDNLDMGQRELRVSLKKAEAAEFGLTFADVFRTLAGANDGFLVGTFNDLAYAEDLDVRLKYQEQYRSNEDQLLDVSIKSPTTQSLISLSQVAQLQYRQGYANHFRHNGKRAVIVTADVDSSATDADRVNRIIMSDLAELDARDDRLTIVAEGQFIETRESFESLLLSALVAVAAMYLILAAQFNSYLQPLIVLSSLIFGTIGMVMGLVVNNYPLSVITGIAMVGLFGIMVNDAILLVSFINGERARGAPVRQAVIHACKIRLRPIMLTTVTTVIGLLPMAMGVGGYNKIWSPFATCICWGLTAATILILVMLPAFYLIVEDLKSAIVRLLHAMFGPPEVEPSAP
ncbi:MAG: efflux RND transporter permease subunit, partial [Planctomycetota bacterium]|nr:efflux RND transporter permease subunit [Planctomycetota bacterium]